MRNTSINITEESWVQLTIMQKASGMSKTKLMVRLIADAYKANKDTYDQINKLMENIK